MTNPYCIIGHLSHLFAIIPTALTSILAVWIGYNQWKTNQTQAQTSQEKLRLDLYDKRFEIYSTTFDFNMAIQNLKDSTVDGDEFKAIQREFIKRKEESKFLFDDGSGVYGLLEELHTQSFKVIGFWREYAKSLPNDPSNRMGYEDRRQAMEDACRLFLNKISELQNKMSDYLDFHKITGR